MSRCSRVLHVYFTIESRGSDILDLTWERWFQLLGVCAVDIMGAVHFGRVIAIMAQSISVG